MVVTVAVPESTVLDASVGVVLSMSLPHSVSLPLCYDCGQRSDGYGISDCTAQVRTGYPSQ